MSDESKFDFFSFKLSPILYVGERSWVGYKTVCLQPSIKHKEGSVVGRGCILVSDVGDLVQSDGIMNSEK